MKYHPDSPVSNTLEEMEQFSVAVIKGVIDYLRQDRNLVDFDNW